MTSVSRRRRNTALREAASAAVTLAPLIVMSVTSRPPESILPSPPSVLRMKGRRSGRPIAPAPLPSVRVSVGRREQGLAARVLDLRRPHLLDVFHDLVRHRHVVELLGHLVALGVG